ncbi:DRAP deaminase [Hesseltinella vesiculosa]|uniref:Pseudouridine synthase n=1 Tax=Hesseltinella vesiculosa TaxID=101127 RepID=A0A1X2G5J8_9FUNG|nr:DRAP deaminase [Hesseltinella vesiculosa]
MEPDKTVDQDRIDQTVDESKKRKPEGSPQYRPKRKVVQKRKIDFKDIDDLDQAEYFFEHGLRKVKPYYFVYRAYAKGRWVNRSIIDIFTTEFRDRSEFYYRYAIDKGLITLNGKPVGVDTIVNNGDIVGHEIHRHEPPVPDTPVNIVYESDDLMVIDKPGGIPVHAAGRYRYNTVVSILRRQHSIPKLYPSNRLDRPTSGLMLISKTPEKAAKMEREMSQRNIQKEYICRVDGVFPEEEVTCNEPIKIISHKLSISYVHPDGKPCTTVFRRISTDGQSSIVRCKPLTGRTHQIRVHLKFLGYPIGNDPLYGNQTSWANNLHLGDFMSEQDARQLVDKVMVASPFQTGEWDPKQMEQDLQAKPDTVMDRSQLLEMESGERCSDCSVSLFVDPPRDGLIIWLHAWKYNGEGWAYETELPTWAKNIVDHEATAS